MSDKGSSAAHTALINAILKTYCDGVHGTHGLVLWRSPVGTLLSPDGRFHIPVGMKGISDIIGFRRGGRFIAIEVKTGKARLSEDQKRFRAMVLAMGGLYVEARAVEDVGRELGVTTGGDK